MNSIQLVLILATLATVFSAHLSEQRRFYRVRLVLRHLPCGSTYER